MPKNNFGGNKAKKGANKKLAVSKELRLKEVDQTYLKVLSCYGSGRFECINLLNNDKVMGKVAGSLYKKVWIKLGDTVLASSRGDLDGGKKVYDIIHKYSETDVNKLENKGEFKIVNIEENNVVFETEKEEKIEDMIDDL